VHLDDAFLDQYPQLRRHHPDGVAEVATTRASSRPRACCDRRPRRRRPLQPPRPTLTTTELSSRPSPGARLCRRPRHHRGAPCRE
jgi:hypothetical protein